jgi:signal transduction histidine kinase
MQVTDAGKTDRSEHEPAMPAAAWLACAADATAAAAVLPLARRDCLEIARAVLSNAGVQGAGPSGARAVATPSGAAGPTPCESLSDVRVPGFAAWLERVCAGLPAAVGDPLETLAACLVLPGDERSAGRPGEQDPSAEAALLRESLRVATADARLRREFERAVGAARIESMRELAYGAGHEINNPLANIATRAQALLLEERDPERRRRLSTIVDQSFRARDMIGGLMVFARPPKPRHESVEVGGIVAAAIEAVRGQATAVGTRLEYSPLPAQQTVFVDRVQVEEALRALLVNAIEAAAAGGRVVVRVTHDDEGDCRVSVEDSGRGMTIDEVKRAFDPFYSGREAGRGAGMGLPKAWRLLESSGGGVVIDSRPGKGTTLVVRLPVAAHPAGGDSRAG